MAQRMELELDIEAIIADHKANAIRQDLMKRQAELQALEAQRHQLQEQKRRDMEVVLKSARLLWFPNFFRCGPNFLRS